MCKNDVESFETFFVKAAKFAEDNNFDLVVTASSVVDAFSDDVKKYL